MFNNMRYATQGVVLSLDLALQNLLWMMVSTMEISKKDRLQIFALSVFNGQQKIVHYQKQSLYRKEIHFKSKQPVIAKIFIIDNGMYSTMLLAEEY